MNRPISPLYATINVTGICNLQCRYCFFQPRAMEVMKWEDFKRALYELSSNKVFLLNLSGGEPFTHPEIGRFLLFAHAEFDHVVLLSNGTILSLEHINVIKEIINMKGIFPIQVSLDSIYPQINSITRGYTTKVIENIKVLSKINAQVSIAMVISKFNISKILESITFLSKYTKYFHLMPFQPVKALGRKDAEFEVVGDELESFWKDMMRLKKKLDLMVDIPVDEEAQESGCAFGAPCQAVFSHIVIDPDLTVRPCDRLTEISLGNLSTKSLKAIWNNEASKEVLNQSVPLCCQ